MLNRILASLAMSIVLAGCNRGDLKQDLAPPATPSQIVLAQDVSYTTVRGIGVTWHEGLKAGTYVAEFENGHGIFYRGPGRCVTDLGGMPMSQFAGGVWMPKDGTEKPKLYYYFDFDEAAAAKTGLVVYAMIAAGKGDLTFVPDYIEDPAILAQLKPQPVNQAAAPDSAPAR